MIIIEQIPSFGNLYQRGVGSHLHLIFRDTVPFGEKALVMIVDLNLKLLW